MTLHKSVKNIKKIQEVTGTLLYYERAIQAGQALEEMGHKQPPTPIQTDNTTAHVVVTNIISRKRLKSMDMRLH